MIERKISVKLYLVAFVLSMIIFGIGVYMGGLITKDVTVDLQQNVDRLSAKLYAFQLLFLIDEDNSASFCPLYEKELNGFEDESEKMRMKIAYLEESKGTADEGLKADYFVLETNTYLLSKKINERCGNKDVLVLFFYSNKDCDSCYQQGIDLYEAKQQLAAKAISVKTYTFDGNMDSSVVEAFKMKYAIVAYPSIIINGKKFNGLLGTAEMIEKIKSANNVSD